MTTRERTVESNRDAALHRDDQTPREPGEAREAGNAFLTAADAAIERALSGRSDAFLEQNRQLGGQ